jgi:hypothetical protein
MAIETPKLRQEGAVLFVYIAAPPMNLLGPELVRDLVSLKRGFQTRDAEMHLRDLVGDLADS